MIGSATDPKYHVELMLKLICPISFTLSVGKDITSIRQP